MHGRRSLGRSSRLERSLEVRLSSPWSHQIQAWVSRRGLIGRNVAFVCRLLYMRQQTIRKPDADCALLQSTISADSFFSQYSRSSCSDLKLGDLFFIDLSFFPRHIPCGNDPNFCVVLPQCKSHVQLSTAITDSQCMPARFLCAMALIWADNQRLIEE